MTDQEIFAKADRYLAIAEWAKRRYTVNHRLVLSIGACLSRYSKIERAAFERYVLPYSRRVEG